MVRRAKSFIVFMALLTLCAGTLSLAESNEAGSSKEQRAHAFNPLTRILRIAVPYVPVLHSPHLLNTV